MEKLKATNNYANLLWDNISPDLLYHVVCILFGGVSQNLILEWSATAF